MNILATSDEIKLKILQQFIYLRIRYYLADVASHTNKNSETLEEMTIALPDFPAFLSDAQLIDTSGSYFGTGKGHNTKIERPILTALNRVDEIFDLEESKSYGRVAYYIHCRLTALGYENFLVIGVSASQAVSRN